MAASARVGWALALALTLGACRDPPPRTPKNTVLAFARAVEAARQDPEHRRRVYELLSQRGKDSLTERAQLASQVSGWLQQPWEMLAPGRIRLRVSVDPSGMTARVDGARAWVTVRGAGGMAEVPLVREAGGWRIDLAVPPMAQMRPGDQSTDGGVGVLPRAP